MISDLKQRVLGVFDFDLDFDVVYSSRFKMFNAAVYILKSNRKKLKFKLSSAWKDVNEEILIGLLQHLLNRAFNKDVKTYNIDLYSSFISNKNKYINRVYEPYLSSVFDELNKEYFDSLLEKPSLKWGRSSFRQLGKYSFDYDEITISPVLQARPDLLHFVMYHEMLHKFCGYDKKTSKNIYHSKEFKYLEKRFKIKNINKELHSFVLSLKR